VHANKNSPPTQHIVKCEAVYTHERVCAHSLNSLISHSHSKEQCKKHRHPPCDLTVCVHDSNESGSGCVTSDGVSGESEREEGTSGGGSAAKDCETNDDVENDCETSGAENDCVTSDEENGCLSQEEDCERSDDERMENHDVVMGNNDVCEVMENDDVCEVMENDDVCEVTENDDVCEVTENDDVCEVTENDDVCEVTENDVAGSDCERNGETGAPETEIGCGKIFAF
jgi:hypothetical protein